MATLSLITLIFILEVGCGNVLGHHAKTDCEICDGKGSYQRYVGIFTNPYLRYGYNYVTTIPICAVNITISQLQTEHNHLAIRKKIDQSYIINGDWKTNQPGQYLSNGTIFTYRQERDGSNIMNEYITSPGPLHEQFELMLLKQDATVSIRYEFDVPLNNHNTMLGSMTDALMSKSRLDPNSIQTNGTLNSDYDDDENSIFESSHFKTKHWRHYTWKSCLKSCRIGAVKPSYVCMHKINEMIVSEVHCAPMKKPPVEDYSCDTNKSCLPEWVPLEWSSCSASCGEGMQRRKVLCKQFIRRGSPITFPYHACTSPPPIMTQKCYLKPCSFEVWETGPWSQCSPSCGPGSRNRSVQCRSGYCDPNEKPASWEPCFTVCNKASWLMTEWSEQCSKNCGDGFQMRHVICYGEGECDTTRRPEGYRPCRIDKSCSGQWFEGPWGKCNGVCEYGEQRRDVVCIARVENNFIVIPDYNCDLNEKPVTVQRCVMPPCSNVWYTTDWSSCSSSCGGGTQTRKVFCIKENSLSTQCPMEMKPRTTMYCNILSCPEKGLEPGCADKLPNCKTAFQARLCLYGYYKSLCCQACYNRR